MIKFTLILLSLFSFSTIAQNIEVVGVATSATDGEPLPGVVIKTKGTSTVAQTGFDGAYSIEAGNNDVLIFTYLGMQEQSVSINGRTTVNVVMKEDSQQLEGVVVTALGISREKKSLTYATQEVSGAALQGVKESNPINSLSGKVAGLNINKSSSGVGGSVKVVLRGNTSTTNNQVLYVIDGIPMLNTNSQQPNESFGSITNGNIDNGDVISLLNPDDIESISVLKGASAAALYGSQGSNGVILITTKSGKSGKTKVSISSNSLVDQAAYFPNFDDKTGERVKDFFDTGFTQTSAVTISGGNDKSQAFISYSNVASNGIMPTNTLSRNNFSMKGSTSLFDGKMKMTGTASFSKQDIDNRPINAYYFNPLTGLYGFPGNLDFNDYNGNNFEEFNTTRNLYAQKWHANSDKQQNPYWILNRNRLKNFSERFSYSGNLSYKLTDWLSVRARLKYSTYSTGYERKSYATTQGTLSHVNGKHTYSVDKNEQLYTDANISFNKNLTEDIDVTANIGGIFIQNTTGDRTSYDSGIQGGLKYANIFTLANFNTTAGLEQTLDAKTKTQALYGTATIGYKKYLYLDLTARSDWSSTFAFTKTTSVFYPSVGVSGIISDIVNMPTFISLLKLRGSWGQIGKAIPAFISNPRSSINAGNIVPPVTGPSPNHPLKPEIQTSYEAGLETSLFLDRINLNLTYWRTITEDQYVAIPAPTSNPFGYTNYAISGGQIINSGIEAVLSIVPVQTSSLKWTTNFNFATFNNVVEELPEDLEGTVILTPAGVNNYRYVLKKGKRFGVIQGKKLERDSNGNLTLKDGKPQVSSDFTDVGSPFPDFTLGWGNTVSYKDIHLNFLIDSRFGGKVMSLTQAGIDASGNSPDYKTAVDNGGVDVNGTIVPTEDYFKAKASGALDLGRNGATTEYVYDATNVMLREVSLGYTFKFKGSIFLENASISLVGRNLLFLYKDAPFDPNVSLSTGEGLQGVDIFALPSTRSYGLNVSLNF